MKIVVQFLGGKQRWQQYVQESAEVAGKVLAEPAFLARVRSHAGFDETDKTPVQIADLLEHTKEIQIKVDFYWNPVGPSIAKERDGVVSINTAKGSRGAGSPGNVAHEVMHVLGFSHDGNRPRGNGKHRALPDWRLGRRALQQVLSPRAERALGGASPMVRAASSLPWALPQRHTPEVPANPPADVDARRRALYSRAP